MAQATPCPELDRLVRRPGGWRWHAQGARGVAALERYAAGTQRSLEDRGHRSTALAADGELFVKRFRMRDTSEIARETLRAGRHVMKGAWVEARGALLLCRTVGRGARLFALGERRRLGLVVEQVLLFEALREHSTLGRMIAAADPAARLGLVERAGRLALELDARGLAHLDLNHRNVMLHGADPARDCLVDAELVLEVTPRGPDVLAFVLGYLFQHGLAEFVDRTAYRPLAQRLLAQGLGLERAPLAARQACEYFTWTPLSRRQRVRLARSGLAGLPQVERALRAAAR
jgi:hypothetical protein